MNRLPAITTALIVLAAAGGRTLAQPSPTPPPAVHFVSQTGNDVYPYTSWADAAWKVESALAACWTDGTVMVAPYSDPYYFGALAFKTSMTITGSDPANRPTCVLNKDIDNTGAWFYVTGSHTVNIANLHLDAGGNGQKCYYGIWYRNGAGGVIENNLIENVFYQTSFGLGIRIHDDVVIRGNTIRNFERIGIYCVFDTTYDCLITDNIIQGQNQLNYGIEVGAGGYATIEGNEIFDCAGVNPWTSSGIFVHGFYWSTHGQSGIILRNNDIHDNRFGLLAGYSLDGDLTAVSGTGNSFLNNDYGIRLDKADTLYVNQGNIYGNYYYGVISAEGTTADATYNWWGHPDGPYDPANPDHSGLGDRVSVDVLYDPWLGGEWTPPTPTPVGYHTPVPTPSLPPSPTVIPTASPPPSATSTPIPTSTPVGYLTPTPRPTIDGMYFVDGSGAKADDSFSGAYPNWEGQSDGPWKTIDHAATQLQAGDTGWIRFTTYREQVDQMAYSGTVDDRITLIGDLSGEFWPDSLDRPVLDGDFYTHNNAILSNKDYWTYQNLAAWHFDGTAFATAINAADGNSFINCLAFNNGGSGFSASQSNVDTLFEDCVAHGNILNGFVAYLMNHPDNPLILRRCRSYDNWIGAYLILSAPQHDPVASPILIESCLYSGNSYVGVKGEWSNLTMVNTTIADNGHHGFYCGNYSEHTAHDTWIYNSIVTGNQQVPGVTHYGIFDNSGQFLETDYNCVTDNENDYGGQAAAGPNSIAADPLYVNRDEENYRIRYTSPARAAGSGLWNPPTDLDGNLFSDPPSMGAFEADQQPTPTPSVPPSPTAAPTSTATPSPTASPVPSATPIPTASPAPSPTATPVVAPTAPHLVVDWDDYDGDGTTDIAVYDPGTGEWDIRQVTEGLVWGGGPGDIPAPGDYDGDGAADVGYFDRFTGEWHILSLNRGVLADGEQWGVWGDVPVPGDYDGNGTADLAVFRPSTNRWVIRNVTVALWGVPGDIPVPGDYTGDGTTDIAMLRPSSGIWFVRWIQERVWWRDGDTAVPMDYDGDGTTDLAVYRPSIGRWFIRHLSGSTSYTVNWGVPGFGDIPVVGDFDGDGSADATAFRPMNNRWWIRYSSRDPDYVEFPARSTDSLVTGATSY